MRRLLCIIGLVLAAASASAVAARAQGAGDLSRDWDLRAGFFVPERGDVRAAQGDVMFTAGAERAFYVVDRWQASISIDYYGAGSIYNVPITLNLRGDTGRLRYGAGAGIGLGHDLTHGLTSFSFNLLVGYYLTTGSNPITADVRYMGVAASEDLNGWAFTLGYHF